LRRRFAIRGVPRLREAISHAPSSVSSTPRIPGVELEPASDAEPIPQRGGEQAGASRRPHERESGQVDLDRPGTRPLTDQDVELEVLHRRVEDLFHDRAQPVDLVYEEDVAVPQVRQDRGEIPRPLQDRAGGGLDVDPHLVGDDPGESRLPEARGAREEHVVEGVASASRGFDEDL
jgi:hypothetical protein